MHSPGHSLTQIAFRIIDVLRKPPLACLVLFWAAAGQADPSPELAASADLPIPLAQTASGGFELQGELNGVVGDFLLDTGASMVTINREMFNKIQKHSSLRKIRSVGARLASGKVKLLDVYRSEHLIIGAGCDLGPIEFAVVDHGGRNLLGMNALSQAAPFTISLAPAQLVMSDCTIL